MVPSAVALALAVDVRSLTPERTEHVHLVAEVHALAAGIERVRPPLSVVFAVDTSGSMAGPPLEHVIQSIDRLLDLLDPGDRVGVVAFSDGAHRIVPLSALDGEAKREIAAKVHRLMAGGATHMESGIQLAASSFPPRTLHERQVILLLSDGAPNRGKTTADELAAMAQALRPEIAVSTLGYGAHHNEDLLERISEAGAGRYHFIADPLVCAFEFARAIGAQGDVVAESITLSLSPEPGVTILRFVGSPAVRFGAAGLAIDVPDLLEDARHLTVAELRVQARREPGTQVLLKGALSYRRAGRREVEIEERSLAIPVGIGDAGPVPDVRASILRARADEVRAEARALADRGQFEGAAAVLARLIAAIRAEPGFTANDGSPLAEALEQLVDEATAMERKPNPEDYKSFRRAQMGVVMSHAPPAAPTSAPMSRRVLEGVAGTLPDAHLRVLGGQASGARFRLDAPRIVIGRTQSADICLQDPSVSRQHTTILGQGGRFVVVDMGSTNPTLVNGARLERPHLLETGDVVKIGEIELLYEEAPPDA